MTEWPVVAIRDVTSLVKRGRAPQYTESGVRVVSQKCVRAENVFDPSVARRTDVIAKPVPEWAYLRPGDVLVNSTGHGTLGRACLVPLVDEPTTVDGHVSIVRPNPAIIAPPFLGSVLSHMRPVLESLQSGSTKQTELSPTALASVEIPLPTLTEQWRIVAVMSAVDDHMVALESQRAAVDRTYADALGLLWLDQSHSEPEPQRLAQHMELDVHRTDVQPNDEYQIAGVLNAGKGLIARQQIKGADTGYSTLNRLNAGQVVMRKLTAWEGTVAVVSPAFDGYFASIEFPTFSLRSSMSTTYFGHVCRSPRLWREMRNRVTGSVERRKRLSPEQFLDVALPIPPISVQATVGTALDGIQELGWALVTELAALRALRADLLTALLSQEISVDPAVDKFIKAA